MHDFEKIFIKDISLIARGLMQFHYEKAKGCTFNPRRATEVFIVKNDTQTNTYILQLFYQPGDVTEW